MPNAAQVNFNVTNLTQNIATPLQGVSFVLGRAIRGPFNEPTTTINTWPDFVRKYGGLMADSDAPLLVKRLLEKGGSIRFARMGHYEDPTDPTSLSAVKAAQPPVTILGYDTEFVADNVIAMTINGTPITPVNFVTDNATTFDALQAEIGNHVDVAYVGKSTDTDGNITLYISPITDTALAITADAVTGGLTQPVATHTSAEGITDITGNPLFKLVPKYAGADINNFKVTITPGSNGGAGYFNLQIQHVSDPLIMEQYNNLKIEGNPTAATSDYLNDVVNGSMFFSVEYEDLSYLTAGTIVPANLSFKFVGGTDGTDPDENDYIGDSAARTGFHAFDEYDDAMQIAVFDMNSEAIHVAGSAYADNRKDLIYFVHFDNSLTTKQAIIAKRTTLGINSKYTYLYGGGLKIKDPLTGILKNILGHGDVFANIAASDTNYGEWYSFAGTNRGLINNVLGVVNNFGSPGTFRDLNDLANRQINMIINKNNSVMLWGNHSAQLANDQEKQTSIVRLIIFLKKALRPTLESFLEEPNEFATWKRIYYTVLPFLEDLKDRRAFYEYEWQGDQNVTSLDNLQVNNATDVGNGKYRVRLVIKAIPSIQEITVDIVLAPTGVDFEIVSELI